MSTKEKLPDSLSGSAIRHNIGKELHGIIKRNGFDINDISRETSISVATLHNLANTSPHSATVSAIAAYIEVHLRTKKERWKERPKRTVNAGR